MTKPRNPIIAAFFCLAAVLCATSSSAQLELRSNRSLAEALSDQPEPLPLEQAFPFFVSTISPGKYRVTWEPASGHYLYQHAFSFTQTTADASEEIEVEYALPAGLLGENAGASDGKVKLEHSQVSRWSGADCGITPAL